MTKVLDFVSWCSDLGHELPVPAVTEAPESKEATSENRARTGAKEGLYPPAYFSGQYPDLWKTPVAADAAYYMSKGSKK